MLSLLLDSSNKKLAVAIANDSNVLYFRYYDAWQRQSEYMISEIDNILSVLNLNPLDIERIIVGNGPGSYTGVRIALTIAKIWGFCRDIDVYSVSSLEILKNKNSISICLMNARSDRSYIGIYDGPSCILKDTVLKNNEVIELIKKNENYVLCGDCEYLGFEGFSANIFENMIEICENKKPLNDILSLKAIYLKD